MKIVYLIVINIFEQISAVLVNYPGPDFEGDEKPKGGPLEIELRGVYERGWRGVRSLLKPSSVFLINKKLKF